MEAVRIPHNQLDTIETKLEAARQERPQLPLEWHFGRGLAPKINSQYFDKTSRVIEDLHRANADNPLASRVELAAFVLEESGLVPTQKDITDAVDKLAYLEDPEDREEVVDEFLALSGFQLAVYDALAEAYEQSSKLSYDEHRHLRERINSSLPPFKLLNSLQNWHGKVALGKVPAREVEAMLQLIHERQTGAGLDNVHYLNKP